MLRGFRRVFRLVDFAGVSVGCFVVVLVLCHTRYRQEFGIDRRGRCLRMFAANTLLCYIFRFKHQNLMIELSTSALLRDYHIEDWRSVWAISPSYIWT